MTHRHYRFVLLALVVCVGSERWAWGAPGDLDPTFGTGGSTSAAGGIGVAGAVQADGKIVVAQRAMHYVVFQGQPMWVSDFAVSRFDADGHIDPTFDSDGQLVTSFGTDTVPVNAAAAAIAVQPDGKIVVAGTGGVPTPMGFESHFALARYLTDGSLDPDFGSAGIVLAPSSNPHFAEAVAIQSDGRIVLGGSRSMPASNDAVFARFESDGAVDSGFGSGGTTAVTWGDIHALQLEPSGNIVGVGAKLSPSMGVADFLAVRLDPSGMLDASFGSGGVVTTDTAVPSGANDAAEAVVRLSDGRLLVGGFAYGRGFTLLRYDTSGALDATFGASGITSTTLGDVAFALGLQADGRIVAAGSRYNGLDYNVAVTRFGEDGTADPAFGSGGGVVVAFTNADDWGQAVFIQADQKIVVAGRSGESALVARFETAGPHRPISGRSLLLRNPAAGPAANQVVYVAKDTRAAIPATVFEDPRCAPDGSGAGATLKVSGLGGTFVISLPCGGWTSNAAGTRYRYRDLTGATCKTVSIRKGRSETAVCRGSQVAYVLGATQGSVSVVLSTGASGAERVSCAEFSPLSATIVKDGLNGKAYLARRATAPPACP